MTGQSPSLSHEAVQSGDSLQLDAMGPVVARVDGVLVDVVERAAALEEGAIDGRPAREVRNEGDISQGLAVQGEALLSEEGPEERTGRTPA